MAKLMSKKTKEIVRTTTVLVIVALVFIFYIIYPLNVIDDFTARTNPDKFSDESYEYTNDPGIYASFSPPPDTFTVTTNDNIQLACLYFEPDTTALDSSLGTVMLLNPADTDRTYFADYVAPLHDSGWIVILYDQRATGQSGGIYHAGGVFEGEDLIEVIAADNFNGWLKRPLIVAGFDVGGDAAINAERTDQRIDRAIAVNPYLTTTNWLQTNREKAGKLGIPLGNTFYFWWYKKSSGFPYDRTGVDDIRPVEGPCLILADEKVMESPELNRLIEIDTGDKLTTELAPDNDAGIRKEILSAIVD